jgi:hypothetical protein
MTIKRRLDRLIAKRGGQCKNEPRITLMQDGRETTVTDAARDNHV